MKTNMQFATSLRSMFAAAIIAGTMVPVVALANNDGKQASQKVKDTSSAYLSYPKLGAVLVGGAVIARLFGKEYSDKGEQMTWADAANLENVHGLKSFLGHVAEVIDHKVIGHTRKDGKMTVEGTNVKYYGAKKPGYGILGNFMNMVEPGLKGFDKIMKAKSAWALLGGWLYVTSSIPAQSTQATADASTATK